MTDTEIIILAEDLLPLIAARATAAHTEPERVEWVLLYDEMFRTRELLEEWIISQQRNAELEPGP
jgi:hypothetical protein